MDGQNYLNQISKNTTSPTKKLNLKNLLASKMFIFSVISVIILIIIITVGMSLGKGGEQNLSYSLYLHLKNTSEVINEYQNNIRSSDLRGNGASLHGVLTNTEKDLSTFLTEKYDFKEKNIDKKLTEQATLEKDGLSSELFEAKINGSLDRIFAHKMTYEISIISSEENKLINSTKNDTLKSILSASLESLSNLYDKFSNYSES